MLELVPRQRLLLHGLATLSLVSVLILLVGHSAVARAVADYDRMPARQRAVVAIFSRSQTGRFFGRGCGSVAKPGVIVSARDDRRVDRGDGAELFVRVEGVEQLLKATPVATSHPTGLDVYTVQMPQDGPRPLSFSARRASVGDRVVSQALGISGISTIAGSVLRTMGASTLEVTFATAPGPEHFGGPVVAADNTVVGTLTRLRVPEGGYLVIPVASVTARLAGKPEPGMVLGDAVIATGSGQSRAADPPPKPLEPAGVPRAEGPMGDMTGVPGFPNDAAKGGDVSEGGRGGNYGAGGGTGTPGRPLGAPPPPKSAVVTKPRALNNPRPGYTEQARTNGTEGRVLVRTTIGADGQVRSATVSQGLPDGLNAKAIEAAYRLAFDPARNAAGEPVESIITVAVDFRLSRRAGDVTGVWAAVKPFGKPTVQFHLERVSPTERRGFVIIERDPGVFACVPVAGSFAEGMMEATATVVTGSCSYRWVGPLKDEVFDVEEFRTCGASGEVVRRSIVLAKIE